MNQLEEAGSRSPIPVTRPDLPPLEALMPYLEEIWRSRIVTNGGPFHAELERRLADYLGVEHVALFSNATLALVTAMQALRITGEVITTPYSFVATAHALLWNGITPVFADIDPCTLNLDPARAEEAITPNTSAIMPVHVYGVPCDVDAFQKLAERYNLKLIYDAAHAFGVQRLGQGKPHSILGYGDLSIVSFHGTKVFNTFEGGAIICPDLRTKSHIDHLKNFGFVDETTVVAAGINGKMSEFNAALGLAQLQRIDSAIAERAHIDRLYREALRDVCGIKLHDLVVGGSTNHGYFPVFIGAEFPLSRDEVYRRLREQGIMARRYFHPLITEFPMYRRLASAQLPLRAARMASSTVICLPIFPGLELKDIHRIADVFVEASRKRTTMQSVVESGGRASLSCISS